MSHRFDSVAGVLAAVGADPVSYTHLDVYKRQVVAGAFGEGHAQYEQADQQSASFRPGVPRVMLFGVSILVCGARREKAPNLPRNTRSDQGGDGQQVPCLLYTSRCV